MPGVRFLPITPDFCRLRYLGLEKFGENAGGSSCINFSYYMYSLCIQRHRILGKILGVRFLVVWYEVSNLKKGIHPTKTEVAVGMNVVVGAEAL